MARKIMLAVVSLAIFIALYFIYNIFFGIPVEAPVQNEVIVVAQKKHSTTMPAPKMINSGDPKSAVMTGKGEEAFFERWVKGRLVYQFRSDHWRPTDPNKFGVYDLEKPEIRLFLRGGQLMHISADEGQIVTSENASKPEPKRGQLSGNIHIYLDRGTDPNRSPAELRPGDVIHIWLTKINFDLENSRIDTNDPISIDSEEIALKGQGLTITWNDATNRLEEIIVRKGEKMILYRGADMLGLNVPGSEKLEESKSIDSARASATLKALAKTSAGRSIGSDLMASPLSVKKSKFKPSDAAATATTQPTTNLATTKTKKRSSKTYKIIFDSDIKIDQFDADQVVGKMICDKLNIIFDLPGSSKQNATSSNPLTKRKSNSNDKSKIKTSDQAPAQRLEITWNGPLTIKPESMEYSPEQRFHIVATGQNVRLEHKDQGNVRCKKLTYFDEAKQVWLDGTLEEPVNISQGDDRTIVAAHLFFDRKKGIASGTGPGFMQERASETKSPQTQPAMLGIASLRSKGEDMKVLWNKSFKLNFSQLPDTTDDETKPFIKYAEFQGQARMEGSGSIMKGDLLVLNFQTPDFGEDVNGKIETLHAERNVTLKSNQQEISCQNLDVTFENGRTPKLAHAVGDVKISENSRMIAADELRALMEVEKQAPALATTQNKRKSKTQIVIREVDAIGNVAIRDPKEPLSVDAESLHAAFDSDRTVRTCKLEGTPENWAIANLPNDYYIAGPRILLDLATENVNIPGPGELRFANNQDIEGTKRDKVLINVNWSKSMKMTGAEINQGTFLGDIKVNSDASTLYCEKLIIDFETAPAPIVTPEKKSTWNLSRFMSLTRKDKTYDEIKMPITKKRPTYLQAFPKEGKPITIQYAKREKDILSNRTTLWGNQLDVDLATNKINIPGAGIFLIENFQKSKSAASAQKRTTQNPFNSEASSGNPSLTKFTWQNGLTYLITSKTAIFDGMVNMLHLAGSEIYDPKTNKFDLENKTPDRKTTLTCDNLKVGFLKGAFGTSQPTAGKSLDISSVTASGSVHLQDTPRSLIAPELTYNRDDNLITVRGSEANPAYLYEEKGDTGQYMMWEGPLIIWNQATDEIQAPGAAITTTLQ